MIVRGVKMLAYPTSRHQDSTNLQCIKLQPYSSRATMPTPIELALSTLLPTVSFLPPELLALANSLLSQSRAKAAHLKPEEEIGRIYACAHIACQRLAKRLELDVEKPKPPVKPSVYKKLYAFLDGVLGTPKTHPRGVEGRRRDALNGEGTPSSKTSTSKPTTPSTSAATPTSGKRKRAIEEDEAEETPRQSTKEEKDVDGLPASATTLARSICKSTSTSKAAPHILVGARAGKAEIESRAAPPQAEPESGSKRRRKTPQSARSTKSPKVAAPTVTKIEIKWPALILALHTITCARMRGLPTLDSSVQAMKREGMEEVSDGYVGGKRQLEKDIDFYILEAEDGGWLEMEWYTNIPEGIEDWQDEAEPDEEEEEETPKKSKRPSKTPLRRKEKHGGKEAMDIGGGRINAAGLEYGLHTMFQPAVDWLSEESREEYRVWNKEILREIEGIEAGG
ncbi:hypothetical protein AC578_8996 [Pseudocercospora eumusae]|uniref:ORC6 first cyclin-like domain-containing protein n=1 Tax=Pseudocercospora eumusae TaxID=321146 RepID=A0A139HAH9_9PEZI|nr:hypothetical protein AC578_8996 [Pseudocercospora eumusae]